MIDFYESITGNSINDYTFKLPGQKLVSALLCSKDYIPSDAKIDPISYLESPYGYPGIDTGKKTSSVDASRMRPLDYSSLHLFHLIRPSISNLLDSNLENNLYQVGWEILEANNCIYVFLPEHKKDCIDKNIGKKRRAKIRKASEDLIIREFTISDLKENSEVFERIKEIYKSHILSKKASSFYLFSSIWNLGRSALSKIDHVFFIAFSKSDRNSPLGFLLSIGSINVEIFLSATTSNGNLLNAPSLMRYHCIKHHLEQNSTKYINTGGVNTSRGGDDSFKRSFGGMPLPYKLYLKRNLVLYEDLARRHGINFDSNNIKFWNKLY